MTDASTDVVVAVVKDAGAGYGAVEGERCTADLAVQQTLKGTLPVGKVIPVYYHLLWSDLKTRTVEKPKFVVGSRYVVFLRFSGSRYQVGTEPDKVPINLQRIVKDGWVTEQVWQLTDQWLSVVNEDFLIEKEITDIVDTADVKGKPVP